MSDELTRAARQRNKKTGPSKLDRFDSKARRMARHERKGTLAQVRQREAEE